LQLAAREQIIEDFREELKELKSNYSDQLKEIKEFGSIHSILAQDLDELRSRLSQEARDRTTAESTIDGLNQQLVRLADLREQAGRVPSLVRECEINTTTMVELRQELESLKIVNRQIYEQQIYAETKAKEILELKTRLRTAEAISQQFPTLQEELRKYKEQIRPLVGAQERADLLEGELRQTKDGVAELNVKVAGYEEALEAVDNLQEQTEMLEGELWQANDSVAELNVKVAGYDDALEEVEHLQKRLDRRNEEYESLEKNLEQAGQTYAKAQQIVNQWPEKISKLERELQGAHQTADELQSTKAANATLRQTVEKLQEEAAAVREASASLHYLSEEMQGKDAQIVALRKELSRLQVDSQGREEDGFATTEGFLQTDCPQETRRPDGHSFVHHTIGPHMDRLKGENQTADPRQRKNEPRKRANRGATNLETNALGPILMKTSPQDIIPRLDASQRQVANDDRKGHEAVENPPDETSIVPESQPPVQDSSQSSPTESMPKMLIGSILSSSPLSDIGELFDPCEMDQAVGALNCDSPMRNDRIADNNQIQQSARIKQRSSQKVSPLRDDSQGLESQHQTYKLPAMSQRSRPPSSSYGEPLLLDDLEGLGSLPAHGSVNTAPGRQSTQSSQDVLTSPLDIAPGKLPRHSIPARPNAPWLSISAPQAADPIEHSQYSTNPSPRRLRSREPASRTGSRRPLQDLGDHSQNIQPATPRSPLKEKNQPNSAIKRKSEAGGIGDDPVANETKRAKRNLSNMEIADRRGTASQSLSLSTSDTMRQPASRLRQSSSSSTRSRSTIVGKNAPAPGNRTQGPKKPRGGSKSEECVIITISRGY
jgi:Zn-dependent M32 family carboxypeptidase